ncbi:MAG: hypothetical protein ACLGHZ_09700, partial [Actinomycetes bacterium]
MTAPSALLVGRPVPWASPVLVLATMGAAVATLLSYGTPGSQVASYGAYWVLGMVLPGTLVSKALLGTRGSWLVDLTLGALTGLMLELFAWAAFVGLDAGAWLRLWPLASLLVFAFRRARGRVLQRPRAPWPFWPSVTVAGAIILDCYHVGRTFFASYDLPPSGRGYYVDLPWHMGLAWEATRGFPLATPQAVGEGLLKYSWFVHAHLGAASLVTAIDVPTIVLRLWPLPVLALVVLSTAVLGHQVSGRPWV